MAAIEPMNQFMIHKVVDLPPVSVPGLGLIDLSITNSVVFMMISAGLITLFFLAAGKGQLVPGRLQAAAETMSLPMFAELTADQQAEVAAAVIELQRAGAELAR